MTAGSARLDHAPRIVVAEDDELLRALVVQILTDDGFEVFEAAHADEALKILCSNAEGVAALFTDIDMPGVDERTVTGGPRPPEMAVAAGDDRIWSSACIAAIWRSVPPQTVHGERPARTYTRTDRQNVTIALAFL